MESYLVESGGGEVVSDEDTRLVTILADDERVSITETYYAAGERGPDAHVHRQHADAFYVLEGELVFELGPEAERIRASRGTIVLVPAMVIHGFANEGSADARFLNIHAPDCGFADSLRARREGREQRYDYEAPPSDGGRTTADVIVRGADEGDEIAPGPNRALFKAEGHDAEGTFSLTETTFAPGFPGPLRHLHEATVDSFYVLEGALRLRLGDDEVDAPAGSYAFVPPGNVHTFSNPHDEMSRVLNLMAPGGFEQYLKEIVRAAEIRGEPPDRETMDEISSRYDVHWM